MALLFAALLLSLCLRVLPERPCCESERGGAFSLTLAPTTNNPPPAKKKHNHKTALNVSVFLLIGKTSALTMNVAGVVKDWLLIGLSVALFGAPVTRLQLAGYSVALGGVFYYNYQKIKGMAAAAALFNESRKAR